MNATAGLWLRWAGASLMVTCAVLASSSLMAAPTPYDEPRTTAAGSLSLGIASSSRNLDDKNWFEVPRLNLRLTHALAPGVFFKIDFDASSRTAHGGDHPVIAREAYLAYRDGPVDLKMGLQIVAWGRTDVLNPTDNLTPFRYNWLTMTDEEQRLGSFGFRLGYRTAYGRVTAVILPLFRPSVSPLGDTNPVRISEHKPNDPVNTVGLKFEQDGSTVEWSISYLHGPSLRPNLVPTSDFERSLQADLRHPKSNVFGADLSAPWRSIIIRAEAAYSRYSNCCEVDGVDFRRHDNLFVVAGVEKALPGQLRLIGQVFEKRFFDVQGKPVVGSPLRELALGASTLNDESRRSLTGLSFGLYPSQLATAYSATLDGAWIFQTKDFVLRPRFHWILTEAVSINLVGDIYHGDDRAPFGRLHRNSLFMANLQYSFAHEWGRH